jgi:hypothetical protein
MKVEQQPAIAVMEKKMTVLFRHNRNFVCCHSLPRSVSLWQLYFNQPKKIKIGGGSGVVGWGGVGWGEVGAINYFFEFPTQNVLPQKYAIRSSSSSSLAMVNASLEHVLMISWSLSFFFKSGLTSQYNFFEFFCKKV